MDEVIKDHYGTKGLYCISRNYRTVCMVAPLQHIHNRLKPFDVILIDQEMPIKHGDAAVREIKDFQKESDAEWVPILGVSANAREEQRRGMIDAGMDDVISKPFEVAQLLKRIEGLMMKKEEQGRGGERKRESMALSRAVPNLPDEIALLEGLRVLFVVRRPPDGIYHLAARVYVHGMMSGEMWSSSAGDLSLLAFT